MNKREKELVELLYGEEEAVLKDLEKQYRKTLDEINTKIRILQSDELTQSKVYQLQYQQALKKQIEGLVEKLHGDQYSTIQQYLNDSYTNGFVGTMYNISGQGIPLILPIDQNAAVKAILTDSKLNDGLYDALGVDTNKLKKTIRQEITRGIAGGMSYNDIARNITNATRTPLSNAKRIAVTEGHRIQQAATYDAQKASKAKGADIVKQWDSTLDGATRPTHRKLDGQICEVDEPFEEDGKKAMFPGDFGDPAEDCNCRCVSLTRARWALDEDELQTLKERAEFFGLDKTKEFKDFENKYLDIAHMSEEAEETNDWSNTISRPFTAEEKADIIEYAQSNGVEIGSLKAFDGDPDLLKAEIKALNEASKQFGTKKPIKLSVGVLDDADFAQSHEYNITINTKALRNRTQTERNMVNIPGKFSGRKLEDIAFHEMGHVFSFEHGNVGVEIAEEAYYNVYGEKIGIPGIIKYLTSNISTYSISLSENKNSNPKYEKPRRYVEVIPEVVVSNRNNKTDFTSEFVRLLTERI